ncbi:MAG: hypothetical protein K8R35_06855 [Bacteroidales bacterium]|nr:hypothetical protein [Bacteroidales bacterium]
MKARPVIFMILTLLIGLLIGILVSAQLRHKRMRPLRIYSTEQQFRESIYRLIQPAEEQTEVLDKIITRYGREGSDLQKDFRKEFDALMNDFWSELKPELTEEQINTMEDILKQRRDAMRRIRSDSTGYKTRPYPGSRHHGRRGGYSRFPCDSVIKADSLMIRDSVKSEI